MKQLFKTIITGATALALAAPLPVAAQGVDFGDDTSEWANDGECDDKRFEGPGMTETPLLDSDVRHDATDCRTAFEQGRLTLRQARTSNIVWGDDNGAWANDGECDDMRFVGEGMTETPLLEEDVRHDATDCRTAFEMGKLELRE